MEKQKNTQLLIIGVLSVTIMLMSIGFAAYASTLNINGSVTVNPSIWSVHFVTDSYQETTGSVAASAHNLTNTAATYTVTLDKPGDFYEFSANVINDGTFNADLKTITLSTLTAEQQKYLTYTVNYNGTDYTAANNTISSVTLPSTSGSNTHPVKVRVTYVQPENSADLPSAAVTLTLTAALGYEQSM